MVLIMERLEIGIDIGDPGQSFAQCQIGTKFCGMAHTHTCFTLSAQSASRSEPKLHIVFIIYNINILRWEFRGQLLHPTW